MPWVKIDDHFDEHPKLARVGPAGWGLWLAGLAYCNRNLTDGFIPRSVARSLGDFEIVSDTGEVFHLAVTSGMAGTDLDAQWIADLLVEAGLWDVVPGGYRVHDFEEYQPTKAQVLAEREQKRAAGRAGGQASAKARAQAAASVGGEAPAQAKPQAGAQAESKPVPVPVPVVVANAPTTSAAGAEIADLGSPALHPQLAEVVPILEAACSPSGTRLLVEPAGIDSMLKANPGKDGVTAAHEVAAMVAESRNRTWTAGALLGAMLRGQKPKPERDERDERRARRHAAMRQLMDKGGEAA